MNIPEYFKSKDYFCSLNTWTTEAISFEIEKWKADGYSWVRSSAYEKGKVEYIFKVSKTASLYKVCNGQRSMKRESNKNGILKFEVNSGNKTIVEK